MYAVIETGGKQYRVEVGTELEVELLDAEPGKTITIERVLLVADGDQAAIGQPVVADAAVSAEVVRQTRGDKVISFKYRPKARRRVKKGHRQELTVLRISDIVFGGKSAASDAEKQAKADAAAQREAAKEAAAAKAAQDAELAAKLAASQTASPKKAAPKAKAETKAPAKPAAKATKTEAPAPKAAKAEASSDKPAARKTATSDAGEATDEKPAAKKPRATKKDE